MKQPPEVGVYFTLSQMIKLTVGEKSLAIKCLFFFNKCIYFIYFLFLAVLGLCCYMRAFSSCGERGLLFVTVRGLLTAVASLVVEHRL